MAEQTIVAIGREYGSAGHEIAERIAKDFALKLYDRSILEEIASHMNTDAEAIEKYDEQPRNVICQGELDIIQIQWKKFWLKCSLSLLGRRHKKESHSLLWAVVRNLC